MRAKVINIKTKKPVFTKTFVTREEFFDLAKAVLDILPELKNVDVPIATKLLYLIQWDAAYNEKYRNDTYPELEELFYELYPRTQG